MVFHRPSAILPRLLLAALVYMTIGRSRGDPRTHVTVAFGGGYSELRLPTPSEGNMTASLEFKSSVGSGLLLVALSQDNASYVAVGLDDWMIAISVAGPQWGWGGAAVVWDVIDAPLCSNASWHDLRVEVGGGRLVVTLDDVNLRGFTIQQIVTTTIYIGGLPPSFVLAPPPFSLMSVASNFVGCIGNVTVNSVAVSLAQDDAIELGCCPSPNHASWTFYGHTSFLNVPLPGDPSGRSPFKLCMEVLVEGDGALVSLTMGNSSSLVMEVVGGVPIVRAVTSGGEVAANLSCRAVVSDGSWHTLVLEVGPSLATCSVDNATISSSAAVGTLYSPPGGDRLLLGSRGAKGSFNGSVRHLRVNERDISASLGPEPLPDSPFVAGTCPCQLFDNDVWVYLRESISVVTKAVGVDQEEGVLIDSNVLTLSLPLDQSLRDLYYDAIVFSIVTPPSYGSIRLLPTSSRVSTFRYLAIASGSVFYQHEGGESTRDVAEFEASVVCGGKTRRLSLVTLRFNIGHRPYVTSMHDLPVVVGTKTLITNYTIAFANVGSTPSDLKYTVVGVSSFSGTAVPGGTVENIYGALQVYFTQADIDAGLIVFNHNAAAGTQPAVVELRISDSSGSQPVTKQLVVFPYQPRFNVTRRSACLVARTGAPLGSANLLTATNFGDQFPAIVYRVTVPPGQGRIVAKLGEQWVNVSSFTQAQLNSSSVMFLHVGAVGPDSFRYRVYALSDLFPTTNLTGPEEELGIEVVQLKNISMRVSDVTVDEGRGAVINSTFVDIAVQVEGAGGEQCAALVEEGILIYVLGPSHGSLDLSGVAVGNGSFSLRQLRAAQLSYTHDRSEVHEDSFHLTVRVVRPLGSAASSDYYGTATNLTALVPILVVPVDNHAPSLTQRTPINPTEGLWVTVTPDMLSATDADLPRTDLRFSVPMNGRAGSIGYFVCRNGMETVDSLQPAVQFVMSDIELGHIIFVHRFGSALNAFVPVVVTDTGGLQWTGTVQVAAVPMNVTASPANLPGLPCIFKVDATSATPAFNMNQSMVSLDISDIGRKPSVMVSIARGPAYGTLELTSTTAGQIANTTGATNWTFWDHLQTMRYTLNPQATKVTGDTFSLEFVLGHGSSQSVRFDVCVHPVPIPNVIHVGSLTVTQGGVGFLNSSTLMATDTDRSPGNKLVYYIQTPPVNGYIYRTAGISSGGIRVTNFTQEEVSANRIAYKHITNQTLADTFTFVVGNSYSKTAPYRVTIGVTVTSLFVTNTGFSCTEGQSHIITTDELNVVAPPGYSVTLALHGTNVSRGQPEHGRLDLVEPTQSPAAYLFTPADLAAGKVRYTHDGSESATDSFVLKVTATPTGASSPSSPSPGPLTSLYQVNVNVILVDDNVPVLINHTADLNLLCRGNLTFDSTMLSAYDADINYPTANLSYFITFTLLCGEMRLSYRTEPVTSFREADIRSGSLYYTNTKHCLTESLLFYVTDGVHRTSGITKIHILEAIAAPSGALRINVLKRGTGIITTPSLNYTIYTCASDPASYSYRITVWPQYGNLLLLNENTTNLTQADIDSNKVSYHHKGTTNTPTDTFKFTITIMPQNIVTPEQTFSIAITPVDDEPPVMSVLKSPLYAIEGSVVDFSSRSMCAYVYFYSKENLYCTGDVHLDIDNIHYMITKGPSYGRIELNRLNSITKNYNPTTVFSQFDIWVLSVRYVSTVVGHLNDTFTFKIRDTNNVQTATYQQVIIMLPQVLPLEVRGLSLYEGGMANLSSDNIAVLHAHLSGVPGTLSVKTPPLHGTLLLLFPDGTNRTDLLNFTSSDLQGGAIAYAHDGSDTTYDQFQFVYVVEVDGHCVVSNLTTFPIAVVPINDRPPVLRSSAVTFDVWFGETLALNPGLLDATDLDTDDTCLTFNVTASSSDGVYLAKGTSGLVPIVSFSQQDVDDGNVLLVHQSDYSGNLTFTLTDGVAVISGTIYWTASTLALNLVNNQSLVVPLGGRVTLTRDNLLVLSSETQPRGVVVYSVLGATYGVILRDDGGDPTPVAEFNQSEVDAGRVAYFHTKPDYWEGDDAVQLRASTRLAANPVMSVSLPVRILLPHAGGDSPLAACRPLVVLKAGQNCWNESLLDARNLRYAVWRTLSPAVRGTPGDLELTYVMTTFPQHGAVLVGNTSAGEFSHAQLSRGLVCYRQNGSYSSKDSFGFRVVVGTQRLPYAPQMTIDIVPTRLVPPRLVRAVHKVFTQGFNASITSANLKLTDVDTPPEELTYYVTALPSNGGLSASGGADLTNFTQATVDSGLFAFKPETVGDSTFAFNFTNGVSWGNGNLSLSVVPHTLIAAPTQYLTYRQDSASGIVVLDAATNGNRNETFYAVIEQPRSGYIEVTSARTALGFSQQDVDTGKVRYVPREKTAYGDVFTVNVTNRNKGVANVSVIVTVSILGQVRADLNLDMAAYPSRSLPANTLDLEALQKKASLPPTIIVLRPPTYGYLTMSYRQGYKRAPGAQGEPAVTFRYDDLKNGWVNYTWSPRQYANWSQWVNESFIALVEAKGFQAGMVNVKFTIQPPPATSWAAATTTTTADLPKSTPPLQMTSYAPLSSSEKFPMYILVPIGGSLLLIPLLVGTVLLLYCIQQKNLRMKFFRKREEEHAPRSSPWGGPQVPQHLQSRTARYHDDLSIESEEEEGSEGSDHGSRLGGGSQRASSAGGRPHSSSSQGHISRRHANNVMVNLSQHFLSQHSLEHPAVSPSPMQRGGAGSLRSSSRSPTKCSPDEAAGTTRIVSADSGFRSAAVGVGLCGSRATVRGGASNNSPDVKELLCTTTSIPILKKEEYWV